MYHRRVVPIIALVLLAACDHSLTPPPAVAPTASADEFVARGFAMALRSAPLRGQLLRDFRDSEWTQHKLVLNEFLEGPSGRTLAAAAAEEWDVPLAVFLDSVAALPPVDLYVPLRAQRMSWTGTANILVGSVLAEDAKEFRGFSPIGTAHPFIRGSDEVIITLAPSEPKGHREAFFDRPDAPTIQQHWIEPRYLEVTTYDPAGEEVDRRLVLTGLPHEFRSGDRRLAPLGFQDGNSYLTEIYADYQDGVWPYDSDCEHEYNTRYIDDVTSTDYKSVTLDNDVICPGQTYYNTGFGFNLIDAWPDDNSYNDRVCLRVIEVDAQFDDDKGQQCWNTDEFNEEKNNGNWSGAILWVS